jgi:predicted deacylase
MDDQGGHRSADHPGSEIGGVTGVAPPPPPVLHFDVQLRAPSIARWQRGNAGIPGFMSFTGPAPGPHVLVLALTHGNEIAGAVALDRLLAARVRPQRGTLTFGFVNLAAFDRFDPDQPTISRFIDEDLNRLWEASVLDGPRHSLELDRARAIRPLVESADIVLDLHSMLWPSDPLILSGPTAKGQALSCAIGVPDLVVADLGHASGRRLIDHPRFTDPAAPFTAILVEAGQHWADETVDTMLGCIAGLLRHTGTVPEHPALPAPPSPARPPRLAEVTMTVTATTAAFAFVQPWRGGEVVARRNTLIALDGSTEIRTPHDDCLLVMPSLRASRGHTAVRLARFVPG